MGNTGVVSAKGKSEKGWFPKNKKLKIKVEAIGKCVST